ncbi:glycoside hydrolase family 6 protein [Actinomadura sp. NAK00032]|uniref:glycoside hydrolase family 6 protein n=1 Tax=Actinomadura sp. NAK00032 TaxID=2742128 RepID=UPI001591A9DA|nr:glycoside hydrolase family 6 protein [Actinomadura sp. NAK00032]QKW35942.1 glycoside hydrolase family 6 protein [Actinomadura sp. NAK00032]
MKHPPARRRPGARRGAAAGAAAVLLASGTVALAQAQASAAAGCTVEYTANDWGTGFTANVKVTNLGDALSNWTLEWDFAGNQQVTNGWNGTFAQSGKHVTVKNPSWGGTLASNASATPGFQGTYSGSNQAPTRFTLNGTVCDGSTGGPTDPPTTPTDPPTDPPAGDRADNPYSGAKVYVNPEWSANAAAEPGGSAISDQPTGVWLDRIAAINGVNGGMGLRDHLDEALSQGAGVIQLVVYDLPGRDCSALASNGELGPNDLDRYKTEFIDPIADILGDAKYADLRVVTVVEIDSLPNLITNAGDRPTATENCDVMKANGNYEKGIAYALQKLGALSNVYNYIDIGHHGWIGWDDNFGPTAQLLADTADMSGSKSNVAGFITNTANYGALKEPYFTINDSVNGTSVRQSSWVDWNRYVDEQSYAQAFRQELISKGFDSGIGMLIDTSRNGWGGTERPTGPGPQTDVNAYVDGGRIDRRIHLGNWCNQAGAGLGERPKAAPAAGIDAYVWIKPPGESDGASSEIPNDEGKGFDRMCDPTYTGNPRNNNHMSGALPDAPLSGHWFSAQFQELLRNAYPPVQ